MSTITGIFIENKIAVPYHSHGTTLLWGYCHVNLTIATSRTTI